MKIYTNVPVLQKFSHKQLVLIISCTLLIAAILTGIYLSTHRHILNTQAANPWLDAFEFSDANGNLIYCNPAKEPVECVSSTRGFYLRMKNPSALNK